MNICESAVTLVVLTTTVVAEASMTTEPAVAAPQAAAPAESEQLVALLIAVAVRVPTGAAAVPTL